MTEQIEFRQYTNADNHKLPELFNKVFSINRDSRYCQWKYAENPAGTAISSIAQYQGRIIGQIGIIPTRFYVAGVEMIGVQEVDFIIEEEHRTLSILYQLSKLRSRIYEQKNIAFCYGFTTPDTSVIAQKAIHFVKVGPIPRLVKVLDSRPFLRNRVPFKALANLLSTIVNLGLQTIYRVKERIPEGIRLRIVDHFDDRFDAFWNRIKNDYGIMTVRDSAYLNWRYVLRPHEKYQILSLEKESSGEVLGFIVLIDKYYRNLHMGYIIDLVTPKNSGREAARILLAQAIHMFYQKNVELMVCWMFSHCHNYMELARLGFGYRLEEGRDILVEVINPKGIGVKSDFLIKKQSWFIAIGDSDWF